MRTDEDGEPLPNPQFSGHGLPLCSGDDCPLFDGKRCKAMGHRPDRFCEPALQDWYALVAESDDAHRAEVDRLREALRDIGRTPCAYAGSYDSCADAENDGDFTTTCAVCIARAALNRPSVAAKLPNTVEEPDKNKGICDNCGHEGPFTYVAGPPINGGLCGACHRPPLPATEAPGTFQNLVKTAGPLPTTGMASAEPASQLPAIGVWTAEEIAKGKALAETYRDVFPDAPSSGIEAPPTPARSGVTEDAKKNQGETG